MSLIDNLFGNAITAPQNQSPSGAYGLFFFEGDIIRSARAGSWNFYKDATSKQSLYYFKTTETDDYIGRCTGVMLKGAGGYYAEIQRPKPAVGFVPGTWVPAFTTDTGYVFVGTDVEYFYSNFSIDGRKTTSNMVVTDTTATGGNTGGTVDIVKTKGPTTEPAPSNVPQPQPKGPMYALIALLVVAAGGILYLTLKKPKK